VALVLHKSCSWVMFWGDALMGVMHMHWVMFWGDALMGVMHMHWVMFWGDARNCSGVMH